MSQQAIKVVQPGSAPPAAPAITTAPPIAPPATTPVRPGQATPSPATPASGVKRGDTPQRLRRLSLGVVVVGVVVALVGGLIFSYLAYSLSRAKADTAQLIRIQKIQSNLLSADATATNAFLVGGLEPPAQRAVYDQALSSTSSLIVEAAQAQPADAAALSALNQQVASYATTSNKPRAEQPSRLTAVPIPPQRQRRPGARIADSGQPRHSNAARAADDMDTRRLRAPCRLPTLPPGGGHRRPIGWLAIQTKNQCRDAGKCGRTARYHRRWLIAAQLLGSTLRPISNGSLAAVNTAADARIDSNNAKSNESLTLIARGSAASRMLGSPLPTRCPAISAPQRRPELMTQWQAYTDVHGEIRDLDDGGRGTGRFPGHGLEGRFSNTVFGTFDRIGEYLDEKASRHQNSLADEQTGNGGRRYHHRPCGLAAELRGRWGVAARLKETDGPSGVRRS